MAAQIEDGLRAKLLAITAVTTLMAGNTPVADRIRCDDMVHVEKLPAIVIDLQTEERDTDLDGYGGLVHATIGIKCLSKEKALSRAIADAVKGTAGSGLEAFDGTAGGFAFHVESIPTRNHNHQDVGDASTDLVYEVELVCKVGYSETV